MANSRPLTTRLERLYHVPREGRTTIPAMAGLRGLAVALVFLAHYVTHFQPWLLPGTATHRIGRTLAELGQTGVDLFFVLSGYLIYATLLRNSQPTVTFLRRRIIRIYPAFSCVLLLYIGLAFVVESEQKLPSQTAAIGPYLLANFLLLPGMLDIKPLITVAWSLSYEAFFYFYAPVFVLALGLRRRSGAVRTSAVLLLTAGGAVLVSEAPDHARLLMFTAGMFLFELMQHRRAGRWPIGIIAVVIVAVLLPNIPPSWHYVSWRTALLWACLTLLCLDALHWRTVPARLLEFAPLRWLGNMSYSYYLLHGLTLKALFLALRLASPALPNAGVWFWLLLPVAFAATLGPATVLFVFVEKRYSFPRRSRDVAPDRSTPMLAGAL